MENKITIRKIQEIRQQSEEKYRSLFEQASDAIMITDFAGNFLDVNTSLCNMFGYTKEQLLEMNISKLIDSEQLKERPIRFDQLAEGVHVFSERRMVDRNGKIIDVEANVKKFDFDKVLAIARDVSARKRAENLIKKSEANLKTILENTDTGYILLDVKLNIISFNSKATEISELYLLQTLKEGDALINCLPEHRREPALGSLKKILKGEIQEYETSYTIADGSHRWLNVNEHPVIGIDGEILGVSVALNDITERKKSEQEKEATRYQLNERVKELTTLYKITQILQNDTKAVEEIMSEIVTALPEGWQYPEITAARIAIGETEFRTSNFRDSEFKQKAPFYTPSGDLGFVEIIYLEEKPEEAEGPFSLEERNLINMIAEMLRVNLMRRHQAEVLKKSEANLQTIFNTTDTAYTLVNKDLIVLSFNQQTEDFVTNELHKEARVGTLLTDYFLEDRAERLNDLISEILQGKTIVYETSYKQPDGSDHWYHIKFFPVKDTIDHVLGLMLSINNITEQKQSEEKIKTQLQLLKDISFITSHELRHEYSKLHSIVDVLNTPGVSLEQERSLLAESLASFSKINSIIYKLNDKVTFGQITSFDDVSTGKNNIENILLIDDDSVINTVHRLVLEKRFDKENIHIVNSVETAISHLKEHDKTGNYLILLDLNMPGKTGWDFLGAYRSFNIQSPVIILTSSIDPHEMERAKEYDVVKNFISKPLKLEVIEKIMG